MIFDICIAKDIEKEEASDAFSVSFAPLWFKVLWETVRTRIQALLVEFPNFQGGLNPTFRLGYATSPSDTVAVRLGLKN